MGSGKGGGGGRRRIAGGGGESTIDTTRGVDQPLTGAQVEALELYSSYMSAMLNKQIRSGDLTEAQISSMTLVKQLDSGLKALPDRPGTSYRVLEFNDVTARDAFAKQFQKGGEVTFPEYLSTSKIRMAEGFEYDREVFSRNVRIKIKGKSGKDISGYSQAPQQQEVLFGRNTRFRVTSVKENNNTGDNFNRAVDITLEEI